MSCLKAGRIAGKYSPLLHILTKEDIDSINSVILKKRKEYLCYGGVFKTKKANSKDNMNIYQTIPRSDCTTI